MSNQSNQSTLLALFLCCTLVLYIFAAQRHRYQRRKVIESRFERRALPSMTVEEAHQIVRELRELEFPYTMHNAMKLSLLKTGAIPTMTKLFVATGQLNEKNMSKRAADTEVLLNEVHDRLPGSEMHLRGIARMNYLHSRFRKAGKILDEDMLHTLGSAVVDMCRGVNDNEWRRLTHVENCAIGVFHKALGDAMEIPFTFLPSHESGWVDGAHFVRELCDWTLAYELSAAKPSESTKVIGQRLMDLGTWNLPHFLKPVVQRVISSKLDRHMRISMDFPEPGMAIATLMQIIVTIRKLALRYLSFPRPESRAVRVLEEEADPVTGLYTTSLWIAHPWYVKPTFKSRWGAKAIFSRLFGDGAVPTVDGQYGESGYDLKTIGPAAQEKRGSQETQAIFEELQRVSRGGVCPFHRPIPADKE